ncbi:MAG: putative porin [Bacteroidota bacterium]|nr:putative porin [Bacteroidota bacterium]
MKAQILNDSVRNVYGTKTTLFQYEDNIKYNIPGMLSLDTTIHNIHNFNFVDRRQRKFQDLGIIGTPMRPIYYIAPDNIGSTSGFHAFDLYFTAPEQVKYYDTKSPFSRLNFVVGGMGRSIVNVDYSRNIKPNWNIGASLQNISADKQIGISSTRGDRNSDATAYQFYTRYFTKDNKYQLLANFSRLGISIAESGGLQPAESGGIQLAKSVNISDLNREETPIWFTKADSREVRVNLHLYQQYKFSNLVQLYHAIDRTKQAVSFQVPLTGVTYFIENNLIQSLGILGSGYYFSDTETRETSDFLFYKNELGFKGDINSLFYNFYLKRRDLLYENNLHYTPEHPVNRSAENYAGFNLRNDFSDMLHFYANGEYLLGRNYKLGSGFTFKYLEANVKRVKHEPSFIHEWYSGNHFIWSNDFDPTLSDNLYGAAHLDLPFLKMSPHINFHRIAQPVYFDNNRQPQQASGAAIISAPGIDLNFRFFKSLYIENHFVYTGISGDAAYVFRIPEYFVNTKIYYGNTHYDNKLTIQAGLDLHFRSAFKAYAYEPTIQQFYLQDDFLIPAFPLADVFVNFKISRAQVFLKYSNLTRVLNITDEYFTTPYYFGQRDVFDFGINWLFFD